MAEGNVHALLYDSTGNPIDLGSGGGLPVEASRQEDMLAVDYHTSGLVGGEYLCLVDLDNQGGAGPYSHTFVSPQGIKLGYTRATLLKSLINAKWSVQGGVIVRVDGTDADVIWIEFITVHAQDTNVAQREEQSLQYPIVVDLTPDLVGGLQGVVGGNVELAIAALNTGMTMNDAEGNAVTPGVGDLILRPSKLVGGGELEIHYGLMYVVE